MGILCIISLSPSDAGGHPGLVVVSPFSATATEATVKAREGSTTSCAVKLDPFFALKDINLSKRRSSFCCCASLAIFHIHTHTHCHSIASYMSCCEYASKKNTYTAHKYGKHTHFSDEQFHSFKFLTKRDAFVLAMHDMSGSCHIKAHRICSNIATAVTSSAILFEATFHYCRWSW